MSTPESKIIVSIQTLLRGMPKATRELAAFEKRLKALANIKVSAKSVQTSQFDKAAIAAQRLEQQQRKLAIQSQELANRQERARQTTERLAQSQNRLNQSASRAATQTANANRSLSQSEKDRLKQQQAADALQRQRSAALFKQLRDQERAAERSAKAFENRFATLGNIFNQVGQGLVSFGRTITTAISLPLAALGVISAKSAIDLDAQVNTLKAFTGSAAAAEQRLAQLIATAQKTPGLTTSLGLLLDAQLRLANVTVETIDKVLPAIGRLNAVQKLQDPARFAQNLTQLVTQNFERIDLKELVGQSPISGQIIKELFNVDSPINAEAIRESAQKLGLTTTDAFFAAFAEAASRNSALANVTESLATRFDKLIDRITIALRPLGLAIIDAITPAINAVIPIIEAVGKGFASLPEPIKFVVVAFGALTASVGPAVFLLGQVISVVGSMIGAYARLVALGLTPTIEGFKLLTQVMRGNAALAAGQAATTAASAAGWIALAGAIVGVVGILAVAGIALAGHIKSQRDSNKVTAEQVAATQLQIDSLQRQIRFIDSLKEGVERTANEQKRLAEIYGVLNTQAKIRVTGITEEEKRLIALRKELEEILKLRRDEQLQQGANLAAKLANTTAEIQANERSRESVITQIQVNTRLAESIQQSGKISADQAKLLRAQLGPLGQNIGDVQSAVTALNLRNEKLIEDQSELIKNSKTLTTRAEEEGAALAVLEKNGRGTARQFLVLAKQIGLFTGNIEDSLAAMDRYIAKQEEAAKAADGFTEALRRQNEELKKAGKEADDAAKERNDIIKAAVSLAKEAANDLQGALKFLKAFIAANPELRASIEKERQLAGKSFEDFLEDLLGIDQIGRRGTALRNAQQQLSDALLEITSSNAEKVATEQKTANDALLEDNERSFALQLISYRQYLQERARLTEENLDIERLRLTQIALQARTAQKELLATATQPGLPETERTKRKTQAAQQEEKAIKAETRLVELDAQRKKVALDLAQALAESADQQQKDVRQLAVEFAQLNGQIEDALNTATIERFREQLLQLGKSQETLNKELADAKKKGDKDRQVEIENALRLNQAQIDLIELIKEQEFASNKLAAAQEFVRRAKDQQAELERQIAFDVEFRGLKEEEAIGKRLAGERKLADSLRVVRDLVQSEIDLLQAKGIDPPQALLEFIRETKAAIQGLGELSFSEQFRLVQKEFDRINDERIQKIQDVERAVRNRDIAEVEGAIIIRRINGEYVADLERQLELLKQIAERSGDRGLQQQAAQTAETVKDTKDELASLSEQISAAGKDAFRGGLTDFFSDILDRTKSAKDAFLDFLNSIVQKVNDVIAENLSQALFESLFGGPKDGGIINKALEFFGLRSKDSGPGAGGVAIAGAGAITDTPQATALTTAGTAAGTALTTGATAAATALTTGGTAASATLATGVATAAAAFATTVTAAGAAFAATVAASAGTQAIGGLGSGLGAATGMYPSVPGGIMHIVEGGYPEAVLTTDPRHASRQFRILQAYLKETRGLFGRIPKFATGGVSFGFSPRQTEVDLLSSITRSPSPMSVMPDAALASAGGGRMDFKQRFIFTTDRLVKDYLNSPEGESIIVEVLSKNQHLVRRFSQRR